MHPLLFLDQKDCLHNLKRVFCNKHEHTYPPPPKSKYLFVNAPQISHNVWQLLTIKDSAKVANIDFRFAVCSTIFS